MKRRGQRRILLASALMALACRVVVAADLLPPYVDEAFPVETRAAVAKDLGVSLDALARRARETDAQVDVAFASLPPNSFERIRLAKRREVRARTEAFARRYLLRGDATGLGFAEQAVADLELFDRILREEAECVRLAPRPENNPVVIRLADFGAKGDGRSDDAAAFEKAFAAVRALGGKPSVLKLGKGRFFLGSLCGVPPYTSAFGQYDGGGRHANLPVWGLSNCSIEGESPETTQIRFGVYDKAGLQLSNCRNCAIRRIDCSFEQQPFLEGEVLAVDRKPDVLAVDLKLTPGSLRPDAPCWNPRQTRGIESFGYEFTPAGEMMQSARLIHWDSRSPDRCRDLGNGTWRIFFRRAFDPGNFDRHLGGIVPGGFLAIPNRNNFCPSIRIADCSHTLVEDVWVRNSRAGAVDAYCRSYMTSFNRFRVFPREGFRQSTDADGCFCAPGTFLYDCRFEAMGDDGMNSLSNITYVHPSADGLEVTREREWGTNPAGSLVVFFDPETGRYLANRRVAVGDGAPTLPASAPAVGDGAPTLPASAPAVGDGAPTLPASAPAVGDGRGRRTTRLDRPVPASVDGKVMIAPRFRGLGTIVSGCSWRHGRWTGAVIQTPNALIENCTFENLWQEAMRMCFFGDWNEGLPPYNVLVRNCRVTRCGAGVVGIYRHSGDGRKTWAKPVAAPLRAIEVKGCSFTDTPRGAFVFDHSGDCRFENNRFENVPKKTVFTVCEDMKH